MNDPIRSWRGLGVRLPGDGHLVRVGVHNPRGRTDPRTFRAVGWVEPHPTGRWGDSSLIRIALGDDLLPAHGCVPVEVLPDDLPRAASRKEPLYRHEPVGAPV